MESCAAAPTLAAPLREAWLQEVCWAIVSCFHVLFHLYFEMQVAEEVSLPAVSPAVSHLLLPAVEMELRRLIQLSHKFQRRRKAHRLSVEDINLALSTNRLEPIYGLHSSAHLVDTLSSQQQQLGAVEDGANNGASSSSVGASSSNASAAAQVAHGGVIVEDAVISLVDLGRRPLPKCPLASEVRLHWLAIDGVQPRTIDNPVVETSDPSLEAPTELSREMQYLYSRVVKMVMSNAGGTSTTASSALGAQRVMSNSGTDLVCECLRSDIGLQELVPYFCRFIYLQTKQNTRNVGLLLALMHMCSALMANPRVNLVPCLHQILPAVFTCVVGAAGAAKPSSRSVSSTDPLAHHRWQLREFSARVVAMMCAKYGTEFTDLYPRVCKTYYNTMFPQSDSGSTNPSSIYGGIVGTHSLGHKAVKTLVVPHVDALWHTACKAENLDVQNGILLKNALVETLGSYLIHILKSLDMRRISSPPDGSSVRSGQRKRKRTENIAPVTETTAVAGALDEVAEQLVPYYCAGSSLVGSLAEVIVPLCLFVEKYILIAILLIPFPSTISAGCLFRG